MREPSTLAVTIVEFVGLYVAVINAESRWLRLGSIFVLLFPSRRSTRTASFLGTRTKFWSTVTRLLSNESTRKVRFPKLRIISARLDGLSTDPPGLPIPNKIEFGPRENVTRFAL